jgi:hypothetical protein
MIIACSVTMFLFYATNNYVDSRKSMQTSLKMQFLMGSTHGKTPEQLAHHFGLKWKAITDKNRQLRAQGLTVPRPGESAQAQAISLNFSQNRDHEDLVLLVLRRVRLLSSSLLRDIKQLQVEIENTVSATNLRFAPPSRSMWVWVCAHRVHACLRVQEYSKYPSTHEQYFVHDADTTYMSPWQRPRHFVRFRGHDRDDWPHGFHPCEGYRNGHGLGFLAVNFLR